MEATRQQIERQGWDESGEKITSSYSALTLHRKCAQAWYYRYGEGLSKDDAQQVSPERDFGIWWSALRQAEALQRGRSLDSLVGRQSKVKTMDGYAVFDPATVTPQDVLDEVGKWWHRQPIQVKEVWDDKLKGEAPDRLEAVYERWLDEWVQERKYERPIQLEMFWQRQLPRPERDHIWKPLVKEIGLSVNLIGYIDEIYEDTRRGIIVARDNKTTKNLQPANSIDDMMESQLPLYAWGAAGVLKRLGIPAIKATGYDRVLSVKPSEPTLTQAGSLSKSVTKYDLKTYLDFVASEPTYPGRKKDGSDAGTYQLDPKEVERLSTPVHRAQFFQRTLTPVSMPMLRAHLRAAVDSTNDIAETKTRVAITGEAPRHLSKLGCSWCDYASLCRAQMQGGPQGVYELQEHGLIAKDGRTVLGEV